ncbi:MAG TPA: polysaccharide deacetylase family protein [Streptosporangiaceae bacterium]|nr:polysaccharide deacetylase family protein [Streptosporangiaceae bacterium]
MASRRVTLTFDNGPTPGVTDHVLDQLAERGIRSTFFVIGELLRDPAGRALAERAAAEGHWIGNHTLTHTVQFGEASAQFAASEIDGAQAEIGPLAHPEKLFRPFAGGGVLSPAVFSRAAVRHLQDGEFTCVLWNCVPQDWLNITGWPAVALEHIARQDWTVIVVHDEAHGAMGALPRFLDALQAADVEVRQDFPDSVVPIRRGQQATSLEALTSDDAGASEISSTQGGSAE